MAQATPERPRYQHSPLRDTGSVRLLHLLPGRFADDIQVELSEVRLLKAPSYEALSYVWGSPIGEDPISCHGEELFVTSNCIAAMRRLRHKKKPRVLWIDAICINQSSVDERNDQVRQMGDVYSTATRTIIWLGEASQHSDFNISYLKTYHRVLKLRWLGPVRTILLNKKAREFKDTNAQNGRSPNVIFYSLGNRPWFKRKWTIQEYVLSKDPYFQCGGKLLHAPTLFTTAPDLFERRNGYFKQRLFMPPQFIAYSLIFNKFRQMLQENGGIQRFTLLDLLAEGRCQVATEPKDAVFGLYGLLQRLDPSIPSPDYSQSVEKIYTETAKRTIKCDNSLNILSETYENRDWPKLPSWAPNWDRPLNHGMRGLLRKCVYAGGKGAAAKFSFSNENELILVQVYFLDKITRVAHKYPTKIEEMEEFPELRPNSNQDPKATWQDIIEIEAFREWMSITDSLTTYHDGITAKQAFLHTLVPEFFLDNNRPQHLFGLFDKWLDAFLDVNHYYFPVNSLPIPHEDEPQSASSHGIHSTGQSADEGKITGEIQGRGKLRHDLVLDSIFDDGQPSLHNTIYLRNRSLRILTTSNGYLGKGLRHIQEGDLVTLIAGVNMPIVLRKKGDMYEVKGPAYILGVMQGEKWPEDEKDLVDIVLC